MAVKCRDNVDKNAELENGELALHAPAYAGVIVEGASAQNTRQGVSVGKKEK